jgi:hypothetical protein
MNVIGSSVAVALASRAADAYLYFNAIFNIC